MENQSFSTVFHTAILSRKDVENWGRFDSSAEIGKFWQIQKPQKVNFKPRLSFVKKKKPPLFSPETSSDLEKEYIAYNLRKLEMLKTLWKKWKTL